MKSRILVVALFGLILSAAFAFTPSKKEIQKSDVLITNTVQPIDSVYYGCVPCCQACSVYTTTKPGECPHCGMVLEKRTYQAGTEKKEAYSPANKTTCKHPESKKNKTK
ncbi:MAG: heavy metal-binding domain-containing protein [Bacteroidia bacterium]